tara:strand:+ start:135573 stop:136391 length:819 start_codon:yes stop_codon:yes gene_type:complete
VIFLGENVEFSFWRYSATGNLFLFFDNREQKLSNLDSSLYEKWAVENKVDGLIFLENSADERADFHMRYLNADGREVEMCGNGARSILHFAHHILKIAPAEMGQYTFSTLCSLYHGKPENLFPLQMTELSEVGAIAVDDLIPQAKSSYYLNTGVPHCVFELDDIADIDLQKWGAKVRYDKRFEKGTNANFFRILDKSVVEMRTYERGVEGETQSCGTGATAVALSMAKNLGHCSPIKVKVPGGDLEVSFKDDFSEVYLAGAVELLGSGVATL